MKKFSKGDRVKYISDKYGDSAYNPRWGGNHGCIQGTVLREQRVIGNKVCDIPVRWDNKEQNSYRFIDLELVITPVVLEDELFEI